MSRPASKHLILFLIWLMMLVAYMDRVNISVAGKEIMADLHISKTAFGFVLSSFTIGYALLQFPGGWLADKFGSKPLLVLALLIWSAFTGLTGTAMSLSMLVAIRIVFGIGEGIENGAQFKLIGDHFEPRERSRANGLFLSSLALGPMIATPLAAWLMGVSSWRTMFWCFAVLGVIVAGLLFFLLPTEKPDAIEASESVGLGAALKQVPTWVSIASYLLFNIAYWGFIGWTPTYLQEQRHVSLKELGFIGSLPFAAGFIGLILIGHLGTTSFKDRRQQLVAICYVMAAGFFYLALSGNSVAVCVTGLSCAAFFLLGSFGPFWGSILDLAPPRSRGAFAGAINLGGQVGGFVGQIAVGGSADKMKNFNGAILLMVVALICGSLCMVFLRRVPRVVPA